MGQRAEIMFVAVYLPEYDQHTGGQIWYPETPEYISRTLQNTPLDVSPVR